MLGDEQNAPPAAKELFDKARQAAAKAGQPIPQTPRIVRLRAVNDKPATLAVLAKELKSERAVLTIGAEGVTEAYNLVLRRVELPERTARRFAHVVDPQP